MNAKEEFIRAVEGKVLVCANLQHEYMHHIYIF
jgi:hypothetical protein